MRLGMCWLDMNLMSEIKPKLRSKIGRCRMD